MLSVHRLTVAPNYVLSDVSKMAPKSSPNMCNMSTHYARWVVELVDFWDMFPQGAAFAKTTCSRRKNGRNYEMLQATTAEVEGCK